VSPEIEKYLGLLERRLWLLRALAEQLVGCRKEFVAMDLDGMYGRIGKQEDLCRQMQSLDPSIESLRGTCARQLDLAQPDTTRQLGNADWAERLRGLMGKMAEAQGELARLNQIHAAFLRRSRLTVTMFMNFLENYTLTYTRPVEPTRPGPCIAEKG
jgi:hypothetical protein